MPATDRLRLLVLVAALAGGTALALVIHRQRAGPADPEAFDDVTSNVVIDVGETLRAELEARAAGGDARSTDTPPDALEFPQPLPESVARLLIGGLSSRRIEWDPRVMCRRPANDLTRRRMPEDLRGGWVISRNSQGLAEDLPIQRERQDLRVMITGDSNVEGVCPNRESFSNLTEMHLRESAPSEHVDVLNLGTGGTGPISYVGWEEVLGDLDIDLHVACVYGGNDFMDAAILLRWDRRLGPHSGSGLTHGSYREMRKAYPIVGGIQLAQVVYMQCNPGDKAIAVFGLSSMALEMKRRMEKRGAELLCVYLPPPFTVREPYRAELEAWGAPLGLTEEELRPEESMADAWLEFLDDQGIPRLDLRDALRSETERCYWSKDLHLNLRGHEVVAEALTEAIQGLRR